MVPLGLVRTTSVRLLDYNIQLISVDLDKKQAQLIVSKISSPPVPSQEWFSIDPKKCNSNAWQQWEGWSEASANMGAFPTPQGEDHARLSAWLFYTQGITVNDLASKRIADITCDACTCSTGERIAVLVDSKNSSKMQELGFTDMGAIACTMEAKLCPGTDVSVGRMAPFCEFEPCPASIN